MAFRDRAHAGQELARLLGRFRREKPVILGLPRGGLPVALEVARALQADLDLVVVRKLGSPENPEYAVGAIAEDGAVFVRREALRAAGTTEEAVAAQAEREAHEIARRVRRYRGGRPLPDLAGRLAIVVDDGVATGATARAAARAARVRGASRVLLAAPVVAAASRAELLQDFDEVVAVDFPDPFVAVGAWYEQFPQVADEEVLACLREELHPTDVAVRIPVPGKEGAETWIEGELSLPSTPHGLVIFAHGTGSGRRSPRNRLVACLLRRSGYGTLLVDLVPAGLREEGGAAPTVDVPSSAAHILAAVRWAAHHPETQSLGVGLFGSSTGGAAVLLAAAESPGLVGAVVCRGGRPDLVPEPQLRRIRVPVLLVVGGNDPEVMQLNRGVLHALPDAHLAVIPGASHLFEEPGALEQVARLTHGWFGGRLHGRSSGASWMAH